jgi:hypothetical protein
MKKESDKIPQLHFVLLIEVLMLYEGRKMIGETTMKCKYIDQKKQPKLQTQMYLVLLVVAYN